MRRVFALTLAGGAALLLLMTSVATAAAPDVTGEEDATGSLTIDPSEDPQVRSLPTFGGVRVAFLRMPVTKRVTSITLGDFARDAGCSTNTVASVYIAKGNTGTGGSNGDQVSHSPQAQPLPANLERLTWSIEPVLLMKGQSYVVRIGVANCSTMQQRTWAHDGALVNSATTGCSNSVTDTRVVMWHTEGQDDRDPLCVGRSYNFDPSMPTGWLDLTGRGEHGSVARGMNWSFEPPASQLCTTASADVVHWRESPGNPGNNDYVCMRPKPLAPYTTEAAPLLRPVNGWYYGLPQEELADPVRDIYLELGEWPGYSALLAKHSPFLRYDRDDGYRADSPGILADTDNTDLFVQSGCSGGGSLSGPPWLDGLGATYSDGCPTDASDYLSVPDSSDLGMRVAYQEMATDHPEYLSRVYGRALHDGAGRLVLQYWLFYFNQETIFTFGAHQGDWEMVSVRLNDQLEPERAFYAQHGTDGHNCEWSSVGHGFDADRPDVYVAETSHASYFTPGSQGARDRADGDGDLVLPSMTEVGSTMPRWIAWPGHWGGTGNGENSPRGPREQPQWDGHDTWAASTENVCD